MPYEREYYLKRRDKIPRKTYKCKLCGKPLERFKEKRQVKFCSEEHFLEAKKLYKEKWQKKNAAKVRKYKRKYYMKTKYGNKAPEDDKFQGFPGTGAFPRD